MKQTPFSSERAIQQAKTHQKSRQLAQLAQRIQTELVCPLKDSAIQLVFGRGNSNAHILFIGEAPGAQEDKEGIPFCGASGKQLSKLLESIGLTIEDIYIANILKYRPPNNRNPKPDEIVRHTPYLLEQINIIQPKIIVTLGNFATKFILAQADFSAMKDVAGISHIHGQVFEREIAHNVYQVFPSYHPAAMLYKSTLRQTIIDDFIKLKNLIK